MLFENKDDPRQIEREKEKPTTIATVAATENPTTTSTAHSHTERNKLNYSRMVWLREAIETTPQTNYKIKLNTAKHREREKNEEEEAETNAHTPYDTLYMTTYVPLPRCVYTT